MLVAAALLPEARAIASASCAAEIASANRPLPRVAESQHIERHRLTAARQLDRTFGQRYRTIDVPDRWVAGIRTDARHLDHQLRVVGLGLQSAFEMDDGLGILPLHREDLTKHPIRIDVGRIARQRPASDARPPHRYCPARPAPIRVARARSRHPDSTQPPGETALRPHSPVRSARAPSRKRRAPASCPGPLQPCLPRAAARSRRRYSVIVSRRQERPPQRESRSWRRL